MNETNSTDVGASAPASLCQTVPCPMGSTLQDVYKHHYWTTAINQVVDALLHKPDKSIIALVGPSGVGKTTAIHQIMRRVLAEKEADLQDPSIVPFGHVEVPKLANRQRIWPATLVLLLRSLHEPLVAYKIKPDRHVVQEFSNVSDQNRFDLETVIRRRKPYAIFLDEFHHLVHGTGDKADMNQIEFLKSICNRSGGKFVIVGTVRILAALDCDGETRRRTELAPFPRYAYRELDLGAFQDVVRLFQERPPLEGRLALDLTQDMNYVYESTIGCVGLLANWLTNSLNSANRNAGGMITRKILDSERLSGAALTSMHQDAKRCEAYVAQDKQMRSDLAKDIREPANAPESDRGIG